jgi:hypothetical protein
MDSIESLDEHDWFSPTRVTGHGRAKLRRESFRLRMCGLEVTLGEVDRRQPANFQAIVNS